MQLLIALLLLTTVHGLFVLAEYALAKTSRYGTNGSSQLRRAHEQLEEVLLTCQIGKSVILLIMGVTLGSYLTLINSDPLLDPRWMDIVQFVLVFALTLVNHLLLGHEVPKQLAIAHADACAEAVLPHLWLSRLILWPVLWLVRRLQPLIAVR